MPTPPYPANPNAGASLRAEPRRGIDLRPVGAILGILLVILGTMMIIPAIVDVFVGSDDWTIFAASSTTTIFVGLALWFIGRSELTGRFTIRQSFLLTATAWVVTSAFGGIPFMWGESGLRVPDAFFEAMSGLTTTGATVMTGLDQMPPGILLWRALLHWYGGIGIIVVAIAVLPALQIAGMQLFRTESSDKSEKVLPRVTEIASVLIWVYVGLTTASATAYWIAGMGPFDAVVHAMSALATGGFSSHDASIGHYRSAAVDYVTIFSMLLAGLPFVLYIAALQGRPGRLFRSPEVRLYFLVAGFFTLVSMTDQVVNGINTGEAAFRYALFNVLALHTGTGFATVDYTNWGAFSDSVYLMCTFLGACTGSTAGGLKMFRLGIIASVLLQQLKHLVYPRGVFAVRWGRQTVGDDVIAAVMTFLFLYLTTFFLIATTLNALGLDLRTAYSATIACLANVGPGLGPIVGPAGNYVPLPDAAIWLLSLAMLVGRLEIFTVLVLLMPRFWRG